MEALERDKFIYLLYEALAKYNLASNVASNFMHSLRQKNQNSELLDKFSML
jgi:hypothetical protein